MYFGNKLRIAVWVVSCVTGIAIAFIPFYLGLYVPQLPYLVPLNQKSNNTMALGIIIALTPPAIVEFSNYRWSKQVDNNVPRLLRDISEGVRSGVTLPKALEEASQRNYGPISKELEHAFSLFYLGENWQNSLNSLAKRLKRPSVHRLSIILTEAHQTGGKIIEVLDTSVNILQSLDEHKEEQNNNMRPYITTMYMAIIIFLIISRVVLNQFLAPICQMSNNASMTEVGFMTNALSIDYYTSILFWASNIESIFGGLIAGKMGEKSLSAGLFHSVILMILTLIVFNVAM